MVNRNSVFDKVLIHQCTPQAQRQKKLSKLLNSFLVFWGQERETMFILDVLVK